MIVVEYVCVLFGVEYVYVQFYFGIDVNFIVYWMILVYYIEILVLLEFGVCIVNDFI